MTNICDMYFYSVIFVLFSNFLTVQPVIFTSLASMEKSLYAERYLAAKLRDYIESERKRLQILESLAGEYDEHSNKALENPTEFLGNPINAYLFVKKFTSDWSKVGKLALEESKDHKNDIEELQQYLPEGDDITGAVQAITRLQDVYDIPAKEMAAGNVGGVKTYEMTAEDCFELGRIAFELHDYFHAFHWMAVAKDRYEKESEKSANLVDILDYQAWAAHELGNNGLALKLSEDLLKLDPNHIRVKNNRLDFQKLVEKEDSDPHIRYKREITNTSTYVPKPLAGHENTTEHKSYRRLCQGKQVKPNEETHKLVCRYRHNNHPRLLLSPIKEEEVYRNATLVLFHDIVSDKEIAVITNLAVPRLRRATVHNPQTGKLEHANYRITETAWLRSEEDPLVDRVQHRIKAVTGLDLKSADDLQVANYGIGGHYTPHFDFTTKDEGYEDEKNIGNRIATFLLYMTNVTAGGATVFPRIDVRVVPKKGQAVFWYNLRRSGKGIYETRHAACPVLVGTKWVSNKWIRTRGQEFRRPCGLTEDE